MQLASRDLRLPYSGASLLPGRLRVHVLSSFSSLQDEASTATSTAAQAQAEVGAAAHPLHVGRRHRADFAAFRELSSSDDDDEHEHDDEHDDDEHDEVNAEHDDEHEHTVETLRYTSAGQPVLSTTTPSATTTAAAAQNAATETAGRSMLRRLSDGLTQRFHDSGCMARSMSMSMSMNLDLQPLSRVKPHTVVPRDAIFQAGPRRQLL